MKKIITLVFAFCLASFITAQKKQAFPPDDSYPKTDFRNPLGINNILAGNFAELRNNHFHGGLDIKTNQKIGYNLYSIADGFVSRINVSPRGYGNAIYIDHPNGYTSVYAHMNEFSPTIEAYVREKQYEQESFAVELYLDADVLPLKQGDIIGKSGNSGSSGGPHLHFEIRHTKTEEPINPFFFGYNVTDTRKPIVSGLYLYPINGDVAGKTSRYKLPNALNFNNPVYASGKVGLGVKAYDKHNNAENTNGIHQIDVLVNNTPTFTYTANRFAFDETRAINVLCDFDAKQRYNSWIYQLYKDEGNPLRMYSNLKNNGIIDLKEGEKYDVQIIVSDYAGNQTKATYTLIGKVPPANLEEKTKTNPMYWDKDNHFKADGLEVHFPKGVFYEDFDLSYKKDKHKHYLGDWNKAVIGYFDIAIVPENIPSTMLDKAIVVMQYQKQGKWRKSVIGGEYKNGKVFAKARDFGVFSVETDNTKPYIKAINIKQNSTFSNKHNQIRFSISDSQSGIKDYDVYIDGKWVLAEYDKKYKRLTVNLTKERIGTGNHTLELKVSDEKNNTNTYKANFRKI